MRSETDEFACRPGCGACCIAPSITSPIPGMPHGKPAGVRCVQLDEANLCRLFGSPARPSFCQGFTASPEICGTNANDAMNILLTIEQITNPRC